MLGSWLRATHLLSKVWQGMEAAACGQALARGAHGDEGEGVEEESEGGEDGDEAGEGSSEEDGDEGGGGGAVVEVAGMDEFEALVTTGETVLVDFTATW